MTKLYDVPWILRAQPASERLPATAQMRVVATLDSKAFAVLRRMQDALVDPATKEVKLQGDARTAALNEMHALVEMHYFLDAHLLTADQIVMKGLDRVPETTASDTIRSAVEANGWAFPEAVLRAAEHGQLTMGVPGAMGPEIVPTHTHREMGMDAPDLGPLLGKLPDFDGATYVRALDHERLGRQLLEVGRMMADGNWHTLAEISQKTENPEASVSARIRDLRKRKFGGHTVNRERMDNGLWRYKLVLISHEIPWDEEERQSA